MDRLIGKIAPALAGAYPETAHEVSQLVMSWLVDHFDVDSAFLRINDHRRRTTTLIADWPPRFTDPTKDPLGVLGFAGGNAITAIQEHLKEPIEFGSLLTDDGYRDLIERAHVPPPVSTVMAPLLTPDRATAGVVGLASTSPRQWQPDEVDQLATIAALLALFNTRIAFELRLNRLVDRDDFTRLPDRPAMYAHLADRLSMSRSAAVTALVVKVANLSDVIDRLGPDGGDDFTAAMVARFRDGVIGTTAVFLARTDEFMLIPVDSETADARAMAEQLQLHLETPVLVRGESIVPRVSIGIASGLSDADSPASVVRELGHAVRDAQRDAHNPISVLNRQLIQTADRRLEIELHIRGAITRDALSVQYQPVVDLRTRAIVGMEALVRWDHPTLGYLAPDSFLDVVESMNLDNQLGELVLRRTCSDVQSWRAAGLGTEATLRVNVSPRQLIDPRFVDTVVEVLDAFGVAPETLCLEFTEHAVLHDLLAVRALVDRLHRIGIRVAIDDFGTGFNAFTQLKALPVDVVKIDQSFVRDLDANRYDRAIVTAIVGIASDFGIDVVAEGVETEGAAAALLELGCSYAQGYLFSRPVDADEIGRLLAGEQEAARQT